MKLLRFDRYISGLTVESTMTGGVAAPPWRRWLGQIPSGSLTPNSSRPHGFEYHLSGSGRALGVIGLSIVLGLLLVAEWQTQLMTPSVTTSPHGVTQETITRLESEQAALKKQITTLRTDVASLQVKASDEQSSTSTLERGIATQRAIAGTLPYAGPGLEILLDDSTARTLLPAEDPDNYIVHEYQIRDIVNLLWQSGADGIAINGERFVNSTSVYCVGSTILINDTRTSPPYRIDAVGNVDLMRQAFEDGNTLVDLKGRVQAYGLVLRVDRVGTFTLPAFDGSIAMKHTTPAAGVVP